MFDQNPKMQPAGGPPIGTSVDGTMAVGFIWMATTVYGFAMALSVLPHIGALDVVAFAVTVLVAWSVMERKRWGRLAMLSIAGTTLMATAFAAWGLLPASLQATAGPRTPLEMSVGQIGGFELSYGLILAFLCAGTMLWLLRAPVQAQFNHRKRSSTRLAQLAIAGALFMLWAAGAFGAVDRGNAGSRSAPASHAQTVRACHAPAPARRHKHACRSRFRHRTQSGPSAGLLP